jgi:uncharacterized protein YjiS (DUF1127 family)
LKVTPYTGGEILDHPLARVMTIRRKSSRSKDRRITRQTIPKSMANEIGTTQGEDHGGIASWGPLTGFRRVQREGTMTTARATTIETFMPVSTPDVSSANPRTGRATVLAGLAPSTSRKAPITWSTMLSSTISLWCARSRQRRALANLIEPDSRLLDDIGVMPDQASRKAAKWFWQK